MAATLEAEGAPRDAELSLVFCDDDWIRALNRQYRGLDRPTDVLSFPQDPASGVLGDVVISIPTARRQAEAHGHSLETEIEWLFLHGLLHLLGYDDATDEQAAEMDRRARQVLEHASRQELRR